MFSRAPVVHDLTIAFTVWGYLDPNPPTELVALRQRMFDGIAHGPHSYDDRRAIADQVPDTTLRMTPQQVQAAYPGRWRDLVGA
jgi:hypothetical protein